MIFMKYTGPHQMIWFGSKEADCYGFTLYPPEIKRERSPAISHHVFQLQVSIFEVHLPNSRFERSRDAAR